MESFIGSFIAHFPSLFSPPRSAYFPRVLFQSKAQRRIFSAAAFKKKRSRFGLRI
jgi:hypothetical protein